MREQDYQRKIIERLEADGYYCIKLIRTNKNGIPDVIGLKNGDFVAVECKTPTGKVSKLQEFRLDELKQHGARCFISYGDEMIEV